MATTVDSIPIFPPSQTDALTPEVMPWGGTSLAPSVGQENVGEAPTIEPDYRIQNWRHLAQAQWARRLSCIGFFTQRRTVGVTVAGVVTGDVLRLTYNSVNFDHTVTLAENGNDALATANWIAELEVSSLRDVMDFDNLGGGAFLLFYRLAGKAFPHALAFAAIGTATVTPADIYGGTGAPITVTSDIGGSGDGLTLVHHGAAQIGHGGMPTSKDSIVNASGHFLADGDAQTETFVIRKLCTDTGTDYLDDGDGSSIAVHIDNYASQIITFEGSAEWKSGIGGAPGDRATFTGKIGVGCNGAATVTIDGGFFTDNTFAPVDLSGVGWIANPMTSNGNGSGYVIVFSTAANAIKISGSAGAANMSVQFVLRITSTRTIAP